MGKTIAFLGAGAVAFAAFLQVGDTLRGAASDDPAAAYSSHMRGCMRQMRQALPDEASATGACECMYDEFAAQGYALNDAFTGDFEEMSKITRSCAQSEGAIL